MYKEALAALEELRQIESDSAKQRWLIDNQDRGLIVHLYHDDTFVSIERDMNSDEDMPDYRVVIFNNNIGWNEGIQTLLKVIGVSAESV